MTSCCYENNQKMQGQYVECVKVRFFALPLSRNEGKSSRTSLKIVNQASDTLLKASEPKFTV